MLLADILSVTSGVILYSLSPKCLPLYKTAVGHHNKVWRLFSLNLGFNSSLIWDDGAEQVEKRVPGTRTGSGVQIPLREGAAAEVQH